MLRSLTTPLQPAGGSFGGRPLQGHRRRGSPLPAW